ncbi:GNAT family N-acetyltransferase [Pontimonas sp.]|nr:GNAT family N-acetyltransferase [Pontimonas sp.]
MWGEPQEKVEEIEIPNLGIFCPEHEARRLFKFLKEGSTPETLASRAIPFGPSGLDGWRGYRLVPVTRADINKPQTAEYLCSLRQGANFPGDSSITVEGSFTWLREQVLNNERRILFFVIDPNGFKAGHLGLWFRDESTLELDNVVKDSRNKAKGVMSEATKALGRWVDEFIGVEALTLRVTPQNTHAIGFYENLGFEVLALDSEWQTMSVELGSWFPELKQILTAGPSIGPLEVSLVGEAIRTGWNNHHSDFLASFCSVFGIYEQAEFVIPTDSCTSALHLSLWALGIGPGDEVIVPDITWVATAAAVRYVGATPVFADIDQETWCVSPETVREKITGLTRAVIPVHLYGFVAEVDKIAEVCDEFGLHMIQDAAPGIGTTIDGKSITNWGEATCFSFQGAKLLVSGEGGAFVTRNRELYEKALKISDSGRVPGTFWIDELGKKMKMSNPTAALALGQVFGVERQINRKRQIGTWYRESLGQNEAIRFQTELPRTRSIHWLTSIQIVKEGVGRENFRAALLNAGVDSRPVFPPISQFPIWEGEHAANPNAIAIGELSLNLPSGVRLTKRDVARVSEIIENLLSQN